jgi:hypothetical protein
MRHAIDLRCRLKVGGQAHPARIVGLSSGGAQVRDAPLLPAGARGTIAIDGVKDALVFAVRHNADGVLGLAFAMTRLPRPNSTQRCSG